MRIGMDTRDRYERRFKDADGRVWCVRRISKAERRRLGKDSARGLLSFRRCVTRHVTSAPHGLDLEATPSAELQRLLFRARFGKASITE